MFVPTGKRAPWCPAPLRWPRRPVPEYTARGFSLVRSRQGCESRLGRNSSCHQRPVCQGFITCNCPSPMELEESFGDGDLN